jgi:hypothetical protein
LTAGQRTFRRRSTREGERHERTMQPCARQIAERSASGRARGRSVLLTDRQSLVRRLDVGLGARGGLQPSVALQRACASHPQCHVRPAAPESVLWAMRARARLARSYSMNKMEVDNDGERGGAGSTTFSTTPATLRCSPALQTANSTLLWWHFRAALSRSRASSTHRPTPPRTEARQ